jgi:hypothetical protein
MAKSYKRNVKQPPRSGRSMTFGNDSPLGTNINATNGNDAHTVRGIGRVQRAASKRIFGEAAVGAGIDSFSQSNKFPTGKAPGLHPNKKLPKTKDAIPSDKRTS